MKLYLIGMPGSGKTTLGSALAKELSLMFVDLDNEIETHEGKSIPEIFRENGEAHFRQIESRLLHEFAASAKDFVMSTGGGAPCILKGIEVINKTGISIFFDVPVNDLVERLKSHNDRPLLGDDLSEREKTLRKLFEAREVCYRQAKIIITKPTLEKLLDAFHFKK